MEVAQTSERRFLKRHVLAFAAIGGVMGFAGSAALRHLLRSEEEKASARLLRLGADEQALHFEAIHQRILSDTHSGKLLSGLKAIRIDGETPPETEWTSYGASEHRNDRILSGNSHAWGYFDRVTDSMKLLDFPAENDIQFLIHGISANTIIPLHEITHWAHDVSSPQDALTDIWRDSGMYAYEETTQGVEIRFRVVNEGEHIRYVPETPPTTFVMDYCKLTGQVDRILDLSPEELTQPDTWLELFIEALNEIESQEQQYRLGGRVLTEVGAYLILDFEDYRSLDPIELRAHVKHSVRASVEATGERMSDSAFDAAYENVTTINALVWNQLEDESSSAVKHAEACSLIGQGLLSWNPSTGRFTVLDEIVLDLQRSQGLSDSDLESLTDRWIEDLIQRRTSDQLQIQSIVSEYLLTHFSD